MSGPVDSIRIRDRTTAPASAVRKPIPGSSPHGFAAEETRSLRLLDDPGCGSLALYRIVPALLRRAGALPTPTGAGPRAPQSGRAGARVTLRSSAPKVWQE